MRLLGFIAIILSIAADQYTKRLVLEKLAATAKKVITINEWVNITLVWNQGISFGLFNQWPIANKIFPFVTLGIVAFLLTYLIKAKGNFKAIAYGFIIGGALGNLCDRVRFKGVVDFIDVHYLYYHWPVFNIADSLICIGVVMLLLESRFLKSYA